MKLKVIMLVLVLLLPVLLAGVNDTNDSSIDNNVSVLTNETNLTIPDDNITAPTNETNITSPEENISLELDESTDESFTFMINSFAEGTSFFVNLFSMGLQASFPVGTFFSSKVLLTVPAGTTGSAVGNVYLANIGSIGEVISAAAPIIPVISSSGGGGGRARILPECVDDSDCNETSFCLEGSCVEFECRVDDDCILDDETCWMNQCSKLFDMKIIDVESPTYPGASFNFTYFIKSVAEIHGDVVVKFWLERDGVIVTEGFDTIYMGDFEEKMVVAELFLPITIENGTYNFYAEVNYDSYYARAGRVIGVAGEIKKEKEEEDVEEERGMFRITGGVVMGWGEELGDFVKKNYYIIFLIFLILILILFWKRMWGGFIIWAIDRRLNRSALDKDMAEKKRALEGRLRELKEKRSRDRLSRDEFEKKVFGILGGRKRLEERVVGKSKRKLRKMRGRK